MEITGKIIEISAVKQVTDSFKKREFVVEYSENGQYMEFIKFELAQDKTSLVDEFNEGDSVEVAFNLKGRAWEKNGEKIYFNSLQAWKVKRASASNGSSNQSTNSNANNRVDESPEPVASKSFTAASEEDDLPF